QSWLAGVVFMSSVLGGCVFLTAAAYGLVRLIGRLPRELGRFSLRHGLAMITRPGAPTVPSMVAIGLGVLVLFTTLLVQVHLNRQLNSELPQNLPSMLMADIRSEQVDELRGLLDERGATDLDLS